ncbi:uncharacterized protein [Montipora capricornis]
MLVQEAPDVLKDVRKRVIKVHRLNVKRGLIDIFKDESVMADDLEVVVIDFRGRQEIVKGVGVLRDILSLFWKEAYDSLFIGENERVPFVRHDYQREEWAAIGRILVKGYQGCGYFPLLMSQAFFAYLLFGESAVTGPMLIQSFQNYVPADEKTLIIKSIAGEIDYEGDDGTDFLEMLCNYDCRRKVNSENIVAVIEEIAHKELIQKPQYIADCWKCIISPLIPIFVNVTTLTQKYESLLPSISKILSCLEANPVNDPEMESLKFLKKFIKGLDTSQKLSNFVRFVSGSELMLFAAIQIEFTDLSGLGRGPIAHTCNTVLQLPSTYQSFPELREDFSSILSSDNWEMDIV